MVTLLENLRKHTVVDVDSNDDTIAAKYKPVHDMTSNQAIVLGELSKPHHQAIIPEGVKAGLKLAKEDGITNENLIAQLATVLLGARVFPHLEPTGYVHAQTLPTLAYDTDGTVGHAQQLVRLYGVVGIPRERVCIKIPSTVEGLRACAILEHLPQPIRTLATTCFCVAQAVAAAGAGCAYVAPYVNPLWVHFPDGKHVVYAEPLLEMRGMMALRDIQVEYRRRGITGTKVMAASLVTTNEAVCLTGIDHATLSGNIFDLLSTTELTPEWEAVATKAVAAYTRPSEPTKTEKIQYLLEDPATELRDALKQPDIEELLKDALTRFKTAEAGLIQLALGAMPNGDDSPRPGKRPRLSDEAPDEESANVAQSDSLSDGWFGSEIDFDDATLQAVDDYDVFQPGLDSNNPFLDDDQEVPSSQGEADGTKYAIGKAHVNYSSQSDGRDVSPTLETKRINFNLSPVPAFSKEAELVPHITSLDEDIPDKDADIDFGAYVDIPDAVGFTSAEAILSDVSLPTFMPASQVPIDRESLTFPKSVPRLNIKLAGGGGAIKPITTEDIKASASKLMAYQQDTKWKPQFRSRTMLPPVAPVQPPVVEDADTNSRPLEDIDFGAFVKPNLGFTTASADYDADEIPTFMPASQVPIDRSDLASTSSIKPIKKSNVKLAGGLGGLKPLTEDEIKASAEKLMAYQQDTTWKPKARTRLPRLAATADDPKLDPDDSGVGLLEPVKDPEQSTLPIDTGKGKQRDMVPHADEPNEQISEDQTIKPTPLRVSGNPFSSRPQLGTPVRSTPLFSTPVRPIPAPQFSAQTPSDLSAQTPLFSQAAPMSQTAPSTLYRLGLSQRKPKNKGTGFTTPFKPGMAPGEKGRDVLRGTPVKSDVTSTPFRGATPLRNGVSGITRALEAEKEKRILERAVFDTRFKSERKTLRQAGFIPLAAVSRDHPSTMFVYVINLTSASFSFPQGGHAEMLKALQDQGCTLADEDWAKNHWAQVIWKLSGLARSGAPDAKEKWKWEEAMRQMLYRYEREINRAERPAIRRIQEHDASPSQPIVLCVSNVQIENGGEVGIELTDGWYRIRATTDKALTRAAKKGKLAAGRKIAVAGARLEGGHEGKEVLKAYHSSALKITANSTSLARWDTRLGFHRGPFVSSLRSLSADGGSVTLLDIIVTKLFPVGFVETDEKGRSGRPFDQSAEDDAQRAWEERRSNEASKWRLELEKRLERMRSAAGRLRHSAKGASFNAEDIPEDAETFLEEFEEGEYDLEMLKGNKFGPTSAAWLADAIQTKSDEFYERREEEMERRLAMPALYENQQNEPLN
ncbi:Breast cancer type 2 susceptibility protein homolog AltName: Full=Fanconi anemia group D1 protein homolog [Rhizoctonia solani AG-1 IB]|uniref:BRCA2 protein n=1 Tax=Thanatephorus cucumeris (strain AG1-IB / isolate 7/3/14) TaxID=1108050 RepID=M5BPW5_THACB|nr:Breast cancer type 2 susceptibility protein homolog AltName: Full=Fanconi anemia group D1 protein homolog [Rhizoctonia solani AG-1 IB]